MNSAVPAVLASVAAARARLSFLAPRSCPAGVMGCAGSKDASAQGEAKEQPEADAKLEQVKLSEPSKNAAGRRVSKTVRRIAVRCAL